MMALFLSISCQSESFGVHGTVYDIQEEDGNLVMIKSAARADWNAINQGLKEQALGYFSNLKGESLPSSEDFKLKAIDPSITATKDLVGPVIIDGELKWVTIVKKGTRVNPLEYHKPSEIEVFFDATNPTQEALIRDLLEEQLPLKLISIKGNPQEASKALGRHVFHIPAADLDSSKVEYTPTFSWPGRGSNDLRRLYASFPVPFDKTKIKEVLLNE